MQERWVEEFRHVQEPGRLCELRQSPQLTLAVRRNRGRQEDHVENTMRTAGYLIALIVVAIFTTGAAVAQTAPPTSVVGVWYATANQNRLRINITGQGVNTPCNSITGVIVDVTGGGRSKIEGFYCRSTGEFSFLREDIRTNVAFQAYRGAVSDADTTTYMGGTFSQYNGGGISRDFSFWAHTP